MKLYLIDPNRQDFYNNGLFNEKKHIYLKIFSDIRKILKKKGIILDTIDLHDIRKADQIFFIDYNDFTLFFNGKSKYLKLCLGAKIPNERMNLIISECPIIKPFNWNKENHKYFSRIFTWNDALVDNKKYFHYSWLQNIEFNKLTKISFENKKLIVLINAQKTNYLPNELYSLRIKAIRYLEKKYPDDFDLYGVGWEKPLNLKFVYSALKSNPFKILIFLKDYVDSLRGFPSYKGKVADKIGALARYKFCLCFENMKDIDGYITEKIFDCFKANCVPIYYGASNINKCIPSNTFIDFRQFKNFDEMYKYLVEINEKTYNEYLTHIGEFLNSKRLAKWDYKSFCNDVFLKK